ncbi:hypothetical protein [Streptomyces purpurascens]|uniref:hypothetical protein n=1 Tax=Streptomyces purpurascens TaxID=1924 RepID=UPI001998B8DB|nr:hypothetical protein [Streptomyces purpurascens]MCE7051602.1 hypothetical protein [Streptomyces purpurascens]GHA02709.1 hypothetical protein GCM10010303_09860 [Streptomyces purpurascens]
MSSRRAVRPIRQVSVDTVTPACGRYDPPVRAVRPWNSGRGGPSTRDRGECLRRWPARLIGLWEGARLAVVVDAARALRAIDVLRPMAGAMETEPGEPLP